MNSHLKIITTVAILIFVSSIFLYTRSSLKASLPAVAQNKISQYSYLNPARVADIGKHYIIDFTGLRKSLNGIASKQKSLNKKVYIYFVYLNNSSWVGINEREEFAAASLVKVPLAIATYKAFEENKLSPADQYTVMEEDLDSNFGELYKTALGRTFTLAELVSIMLEKSDNTAKNAITSTFRKIGVIDPFEEVYSNLGWEFLPSIGGGVDVVQNQNYQKISVKVLSNMFLALYNAQYLNMESSQKILEDLSNTSFDKQIRAGVPRDVPVSHKIGVAGGVNISSDCGVVYAPGRNYLLCLGAEGMNETESNDFMEEVSRTVYDYVINN